MAQVGSGQSDVLLVGSANNVPLERERVLSKERRGRAPQFRGHWEMLLRR